MVALNVIHLSPCHSSADVHESHKTGLTITSQEQIQLVNMLTEISFIYSTHGQLCSNFDNVLEDT